MNRKKMKNGLMFALLSFSMLFGFYACKKERLKSDEKSVATKSPNSISRGSSTSRSLSDSMIILIGMEHNEVLNDLLTGIGPDSTNVTNKVHFAALNYPSPSVDSVFSNRVTAMDSVINNAEAYLNAHTNTSVYSMMQDIKTYILSMPNFPDLQISMNNYRLYANTNFTGEDLDVSLVFIEVIEKSSFFWMPVSQGGSGIGKAYIDNFQDYNDMTFAPINWGQVVYADGTAVGSSFIKILLSSGFSIFSSPTVVNTIGWAGAYGSAVELFNQLM